MLAGTGKHNALKTPFHSHHRPMNPNVAILGPVFSLAAWTIVVLLILAYRRVKATTTGAVHVREFAFGESPKVPVSAQLVSRNYMNLLEMPVLFYVACLVSLVTGPTTSAMLTLAWLYVALRVLHSLIHITTNRIIHRFAVFVLSNVVLAALWVLLGLRFV